MKYTLPSTWRWTTLSEIADVISGVSYDGTEECNDGIRILRGGNIQSNTILIKTDDVFLPYKYKDEDNTVKFGDTILVASTGSLDVLGKAAGCYQYLGDTQIGAFLRIVRPKNITNAPFITALLTSRYFHNYVISFAGNGTGINNIRNSYLLDFPIPLPPQKELENIASVLSNIDRKIALNRAMNEELEQTARDLYDYWFLQFDFPDANGKPYRSSGGKMVYNPQLKREIPQGWEVKCVNEIESNIVTGKTPSTSDENNFGGDIPFITIDDIRGNLFIGKTARSLSESGAQSQKGKYIPTGSLCCTCIGTIGLLGFTIKLSHTNQQINSIIFSNPSNAEYMYFALDDFFKNSTVKTGNTFKNMNKAEFANINIIKPDASILSSFHFSIMLVFEQICSNIEEIVHLTSLRDELLPLLMNGQVKVKE